MFYSLQNQRVTEAEEQLHAFAEESETREESLKAYIHHLETHVKDLKENRSQETGRKEMEEMQATMNSQKKELDEMKVTLKETRKEVEGMQATVESQKKEIELHRLLTGTTFTNVDASKQVSCDVTVKNSETNKSTKFRLESLEDNETPMIKYEPIGKADSSLPEFLHDAIEFDTSQAPALMQNVLQGMFPDED